MIIKAHKVSLKREGFTLRWAYPSWECPSVTGEFPAYKPLDQDLKYKKVLRKIQKDDQIKLLYYEVEELLRLI